jgi:hypothetical protein
MASLSQSDLLDAVAAKMDITQSDYTGAQASEIKTWALDALRWLMPMAPEYAITSALESLTAQAEPLTLPTDCLKVVRVSHTTDGDLMRYVEPSKFMYVKNSYNSASLSYGAGYRIWSEIMGAIQCFRVDAADTIAVDYIQEPSWGDTLRVVNAGAYYELKTPHTSGADGACSDEPGVGVNSSVFWTEVTTVSAVAWIASHDYTDTDSYANLTIPNGWEGLIANYCTVQAKMKDEEPQQAQLLWQMFMQELARFRGFEDIKVSVGG